MLAPILTSLKHQFNKTMFNTDFKSYFAPILDSIQYDSNYTFNAKVININIERDDVVSLTLQTPKNWKGFVAGQYVELSVKINAVYYTRIFSISSSIAQFEKDRTITLSIQKQENGKVTSWIFEELKQGTIVGISAAKGDFILNKKESNFVFIAGGSGITPFRAILYQCIAENKNVVLLYYCKTNQHLFREELEKLNQHHNLQIHFISSDVKGRFSFNHLEENRIDILDSSFLICGPAAMIEHTKDILLENNIVEDKIQFEYFKKSIFHDTTQFKDIKSVLILNHKKIEANTQTPILEQLEANQIQAKYGCRMGLCKQCTCTKKSGVVYNRLNNKISEDIEESIQICVSIPLGEVAIDL
jgi:ferredoxin-NADP reductase